MRQVLFIVAAVIVILALYILMAKPVLRLPAVTVPLAETNVVGSYQRKLNINALNVIVRTDGKVTFDADGEPLGYMAYNLISLRNAIDLGERFSVPETARQAISVSAFVFPRLATNLFVTSLFVHYVMPVEITVRFTRG